MNYFIILIGVAILLLARTKQEPRSYMKSQAQMVDVTEVY